MRTLHLLLILFAACLFATNCKSPAEEFADLVKNAPCVGDDEARLCKQGEHAGTLINTTMLHCCENQVFRVKAPCLLAASEETTLAGEVGSYLGLDKTTNIHVDVEVLKYLAYHKRNEQCCPDCEKPTQEGGCHKNLIGTSWSIFGKVDIEKNMKLESDAIQNMLKQLNFNVDSVRISYGDKTQIKSKGELTALCAERAHEYCENVKDYTPEDMIPVYTYHPKDEDNPVIMTAWGHGRTTMHVGVILMTNNTDQPVTTNFSNAFIPPTGMYQGYVVQLPASVTVPPQSTDTVPIYGFCTTINAPPIPAGESMPPISDWIFTDELIDLVSDGIPTDAPGVEPVSVPADPTDQTPITIPGTTTAVNVTIDPTENPELFASMVIPLMQEIEVTVDSLYEEGTIETPFSFNPTEERSAIIQHDIWRATSTLTGTDYKVGDFEQNMIKQYEANTGQTFAEAPVSEKEEMVEGATVLWNTFTHVGNEAKVFKQAPEYCLCFQKKTCTVGNMLGRALNPAECLEMGGQSVRYTDSKECERVKK